MDSHSTGAAASRALEPRVLATTQNALALEQIRVTVSQKTGPSALETAKRDLYATLQLLANRIQYLTRASAATIALREGAELLCEASAGPTATALGASLRTDPGLINQSIIAEQIFCCNNTRDAVSGEGKRYRELGIKAIMVMPLVRESKVVGVLELLANRTNAFDDSHGHILEHFGEMVFTALSHADAAKRAAIETASEQVIEIPAEIPRPEQEISILPAGSTSLAATRTVMETAPKKEVEIPTQSISTKNAIPVASVESTCPIAPPEPPPAAASVKVQYCEACGFPVSEGRKLCLDCEEGRSAAEPGAAPGFLSQLEREQKQGWLDTHFYTIGTILMALLTVLALVLKFR